MPRFSDVLYDDACLRKQALIPHTAYPNGLLDMFLQVMDSTATNTKTSRGIIRGGNAYFCEEVRSSWLCMAVIHYILPGC